MFETPKTESITAQRKSYVQQIMEDAARKVATDLQEGETTREIAIHALGQLWAGYLPHSGKGHAEKAREQVADAVDAILNEKDS